MFEITTPFETKIEGMIYMVCCISRFIRHSFPWKYVPQRSPYVLTPDEECNTTPTKLQSNLNSFGTPAGRNLGEYYQIL
jgi:hypothetical protein